MISCVWWRDVLAVTGAWFLAAVAFLGLWAVLLTPRRRAERLVERVEEQT